MYRTEGNSHSSHLPRVYWLCWNWVKSDSAQINTGMGSVFQEMQLLPQLNTFMNFFSIDRTLRPEVPNPVMELLFSQIYSSVTFKEAVIPTHFLWPSDQHEWRTVKFDTQSFIINSWWEERISIWKKTLGSTTSLRLNHSMSFWALLCNYT